MSKVAEGSIGKRYVQFIPSLSNFIPPIHQLITRCNRIHIPFSFQVFKSNLYSSS